AVWLSGNLKVVSLVTRIWIRAAHVNGDATAAQRWAGQTQINRIFGRDDAYALCAAMKDRVACKQVLKILERSREAINELLDAALEAGGQVHHQTADAKVRGRQTPTRRGFDQIQNLLAFAEAVKENCHRADVERVRPQPDEMRSDALQFAHQHANDLRAFGNLQAQKLFDRHHVSEVVAERIQIIHPVCDDDPLLILLVLEQLLHPRVEIADVGCALDDHLAVEHQFETQDAVRRRVLRPHRDRHLRVERTIKHLELWRQSGRHKFKVPGSRFKVQGSGKTLNLKHWTLNSS